MPTVHLIVGVAVMLATLVAGVVGAWAWWQVKPAPRFFPLLRVAQGTLVVQVTLGGLLLALGHEPKGSLHILYGLLPLAIMFVAEQLRVSAAETVLEGRGLENAAAVGKLPVEEQHKIVNAILRRETGVMAAACLVSFLLALRAGQVSGHLPI